MTILPCFPQGQDCEPIYEIVLKFTFAIIFQSPDSLLFKDILATKDFQRVFKQVV